MSETKNATISTEDKIQTAEEIAAELEAEQSPQETSEERPDWLPEKFNSAQDLAAAYRQLEQKQSSNEDAPQALEISKDEAETAAESAGLDFEALTQKYQETGSLEDADYEALNRAGMSKDIVDGYIRGQQALVEQYESKVLSQFGDKDSYAAMVDWAKDALSDDQIDVFNDAVSSGNLEKAMFAVNGLKAQFEASAGREPSRNIDGRPSTSGPTFSSEHEMVAAMQDPRYWNDPAYRETVERKFNNTWGAA